MNGPFMKIGLRVFVEFSDLLSRIAVDRQCHISHRPWPPTRGPGAVPRAPGLSWLRAVWANVPFVGRWA